jgi:hypothetical protein
MHNLHITLNKGAVTMRIWYDYISVSLSILFRYFLYLSLRLLQFNPLPGEGFFSGGRLCGCNKGLFPALLIHFFIN